jgi:hypothetical protein
VGKFCENYSRNKLYILRDNIYKIKYTVMSRDHNAGRNDSVKSENSSLERVEVFKDLGQI